MKAVAANAGRRERARQGEVGSLRRHGVVERRIEAGNLWQSRARRGDRADRRNIVRQMQRIERRQSLKLCKQVLRNDLRRDVFGAAVNDAMADGDQFRAAQLIVDEFQQRREYRVEVLRLVR